jgi:hypothetical protein
MYAAVSRHQDSKRRYWIRQGKPDVQSIRSSAASAEERQMLADWFYDGAQ